MPHIYIGMIFTVLALSCVTTSPSEPSQAQHGTELTWFQGSLDEAFAKSKEEDRPLFLYWGAVWCPPCNELKAQVFSHKQIGRLLSSSIPVYLDGDTEMAQSWADKLLVSGYPTMLVILPDGREVMRISEALSYSEFTQAYNSALSQKNSFSETLERATSGTATAIDWRILAYYSWFDAKDIDLLSPAVMSKRLLLTEKIPDSLVTEKALLSASVLTAAAQIDGEQKTGTNEILTAIKSQSQSLLGNVFRHYGTVRAARGFVVYQYDGVLNFLFKDDPAQKSVWSKKWMDAAESISRDKNLSVDTRLWAVYPKIQSAASQSKKYYPQSLKSEVLKKVQWADRESKTTFERSAVISGAAHLLQEVELISESRDMLKRELKRTKTPWYYQSSLAALEEKLGHKRAALYWSDKARRSAKGRASRIQWTSSDLMRNLRLSDATKPERIRFLVYELYQMATGFEDGFTGRNKYRMQSTAETLKKYPQLPSLKADLLKFKNRCESMETSGKDSCVEHFALYSL